MDKFEKKLFNTLVSKAGFYIRSFYSESLKKEQWIAILENESMLYSIIIAENSYNVSLYDETYKYLKSLCNKNIVINEIVTIEGSYDYYEHDNMLIYSLRDKKVVYSSSSCKLLIPIINEMDITKKTNNKRDKYMMLTNILIAVNLLVFLISAWISKNIFDIDIYTLIIMGAKVNSLIDKGQVWRLITCAFLHGGLIHIFFNMYALKILGPEIEYVYGKVKYLVIYLLSAIAASIFSYIFGPQSVSVGASGAIFGLFGAMLIFGIKHRKQMGKAYMMNILQVIFVNVIIGISSSNIDNAAHFGGLIVGALIALLLGERRPLK
ncbi:rhomboid family intramembrane serine protease [Clostridium sp.]|uniref:rhomboid family intramembrane serine protease n=1 Tax=Clostridium sp. TaxID=1506 RepID=UPI002673E85A|nr:rhomboid family intramembrane serine protease [Clostridium sp.]MCI7029421.1 rhomboid family intramembrane serine protease [Clostridium sp.]